MLKSCKIRACMASVCQSRLAACHALQDSPTVTARPCPLQGVSCIQRCRMALVAVLRKAVSQPDKVEKQSAV